MGPTDGGGGRGEPQLGRGWLGVGRCIHSRLIPRVLSFSLYFTIHPRFIFLFLFFSSHKYDSPSIRISLPSHQAPISSPTCLARHLVHPALYYHPPTFHHPFFTLLLSQSRVDINPNLSPFLQAPISTPFDLRLLLGFSASCPLGFASQIHARLVLLCLFLSLIIMR